MVHMTENYRMRLSGQALGIKAVMGQLIPSIGRTWRHCLPRRRVDGDGARSSRPVAHGCQISAGGITLNQKGKQMPRLNIRQA